MLGYRSFFTVQNEPRLLELAAEQSYSWLRSKNLAADALVPGPPVDLAEGVRGVVLEDSPDDGSRTLRMRLVETKADGDITTEFTVHLARDRAKGWVWLDLDVPPSIPFASRPRIARDLLDVLPGHDGAQRLQSTPATVTVDDVHEAVRGLVDPDRRGLVFVAGTDASLPLDKWTKLVADLLKETAGLSAQLVLDAAATEAFNDRVGVSHAVQPGTVRTYAPGVALGDPADQIRHRILSTDRIVRENGGYLRRLLGRRARAVTAAAVLPTPVVRLDRRLREALDAVLLDGVWTPAAFAESEDVAPATVVEDELFGMVLREVFGHVEWTESRARELITLARAAKATESSRGLLSGRIKLLEGKVDDVVFDAALLREQLDDEQQERALAC